MIFYYLQGILRDWEWNMRNTYLDILALVETLQKSHIGTSLVLVLYVVRIQLILASLVLYLRIVLARHSYFKQRPIILL